MKNHFAPLFLILISMAVSHACNKSGNKSKYIGGPEPTGFLIGIYYKTKEGKNLFANNLEDNNIAADCRYDTRKIEVYQVINNNDVLTKEPLDSWVKKKEAYGNNGYPGLSLDLPTEDKRVSKILIYLYPSREVDTISYKGEGPDNFPETKNIFYNGTCIESMSLMFIGGGPKSLGYRLTITKPDK